MLTGAPCSGKTTVLQRLERQGYKRIPDAEKLYAGSSLHKVPPSSPVRHDDCAFQRHVVMLRSNIESILGPGELIFFDGGLPDSISYFRLARLDPFGVIESCKRFFYHRVFILDPINFEWNGAPVTADECAAFLDLQLEIDYRELGYEVIRIPAVSVEKRIELILKSL